MTVDLATLAISFDRPSRMVVRHPVSGEPLTHDDGRLFSIDLLGKDAPATTAVRNAALDRRLRNPNRPSTMESLERDSLDVLTAATVGWDIVLEGKTPDLTPDNIRQLYKSQPWLRDQVSEFVEDRSNFFPKDN